MSTQEQETSLTQTLDNTPVVSPPVDIYENEQSLLFFADMPGVGNDDIDVRLEKGELTFEGRRFPKVNVEGNQGLVYRRTFVVPKGIVPDGIVAKFNDGVLRVDVPKTNVATTRQIAVSAD